MTYLILNVKREYVIDHMTKKPKKQNKESNNKVQKKK